MLLTYKLPHADFLFSFSISLIKTGYMSHLVYIRTHIDMGHGVVVVVLVIH